MRIRVYAGALCLGASLLLSTSVCSAQSYTITEEELSRLENNLNRLEILNIRSQKNLVNLQSKLEKSQKQSAMLESKLTNLKQTSEKQEQLLQNANQSLKMLETENKKKLQKAKMQRTIWQIIAVGTLAYAIERGFK